VVEIVQQRKTAFRADCLAIFAPHCADSGGGVWDDEEKRRACCQTDNFLVQEMCVRYITSTADKKSAKALATIKANADAGERGDTTSLALSTGGGRADAVISQELVRVVIQLQHGGDRTDALQTSTDTLSQIRPPGEVAVVTAAQLAEETVLRAGESRRDQIISPTTFLSYPPTTQAVIVKLSLLVAQVLGQVHAWTIDSRHDPGTNGAIHINESPPSEDELRAFSIDLADFFQKHDGGNTVWQNAGNEARLLVMANSGIPEVCARFVAFVTPLAGSSLNGYWQLYSCASTIARGLWDPAGDDAKQLALQSVQNPRAVVDVLRARDQMIVYGMEGFARHLRDNASSSHRACAVSDNASSSHLACAMSGAHRGLV
jgi:hypothetical protein